MNTSQVLRGLPGEEVAHGPARDPDGEPVPGEDVGERGEILVVGDHRAEVGVGGEARRPAGDGGRVVCRRVCHPRGQPSDDVTC